MGTRCNIIVSHDINTPFYRWKDKITLYCHWDGYPENMLPVFRKAWNYGIQVCNAYEEKDIDKPKWQMGRAGKVASLLCSVAPILIEPQGTHDLCEDIEYLYDIDCINHYEGSLAERPEWDINIYKYNKGKKTKIGNVVFKNDATIIINIKNKSIEKIIKKECL